MYLCLLPDQKKNDRDPKLGTHTPLDHINVPSGMSVTAEMIPVVDDKSNPKPKIKKPKIIENVSDTKIKIALPHNFK